MGEVARDDLSSGGVRALEAAKCGVDDVLVLLRFEMLADALVGQSFSGLEDEVHGGLPQQRIRLCEELREHGQGASAAAG